MALSNYEKQKRWREKNRVLYNLQQRNRRKQKGGDASSIPNKSEIKNSTQKGDLSDAATTVQPAVAAKPTIEELREMIEREHERVVEGPVKPVIFRDDDGRVIAERAWNKLQEMKRRAKEGGYHLDQYVQ